MTWLQIMKTTEVTRTMDIHQCLLEMLETHPRSPSSWPKCLTRHLPKSTSRRTRTILLSTIVNIVNWLCQVQISKAIAGIQLLKHQSGEMALKHLWGLLGGILQQITHLSWSHHLHLCRRRNRDRLGTQGTPWGRFTWRELNKKNKASWKQHRHHWL